MRNIDMLPLELFKNKSLSASGPTTGRFLNKQPTSAFVQDQAWDTVNDEVGKASQSPESKPRGLPRQSILKRVGTTINVQPTVEERQQKKSQFTSSVMNTIAKLKGVAKWTALSRYISTVVSRKRATKSKSSLDELSGMALNSQGEDSLKELEFLKLHTPGFSLQPARLYPEKVETYNISVLQEVRIFKDNFENNIKKERYVLGILEILRSSIFSVLEGTAKSVLTSDPGLEQDLSNQNQKSSAQFFKRFPHSAQKPDENWALRNLRDQFFRTTKLYEECLISFVVRIEYKALNNIDINSHVID